MLSPPMNTHPSAAHFGGFHRSCTPSQRQQHVVRVKAEKPHEKTRRRVFVGSNSYHSRTKRKTRKVSTTCFTPELVCIGTPGDELSTKRTKSFEEFFISHTKGGSECDSSQQRSQYRLTLDEIVAWAKSQINLSDLKEDDVDFIVSIMKVPLQRIKRNAFNKLECYAAARALMCLNKDFDNLLAQPSAFIERCSLANTIIDRIADLFPENFGGSRALAQMIYELGFMQGNFTRASECLAPLYGLLSTYDVPEPGKHPVLMPHGTNTSKARTMYEYLVDGYTHSTSLSYVNRFCRYRAFIVAGGSAGSTLGKGCEVYAHRLATTLKQWCFDVSVFAHLTKNSLFENLEKELKDSGDLSEKYDGWLFYFLGHGREGVIESKFATPVDIQAIHNAVAENVPDDFLKMFIFDSCQNEAEVPEPMHVLEPTKPNAFILQSAPKYVFARAILTEVPSPDGDVSDEAIAIPSFTKGFIETLEATRGCVKLRDLVAQATKAMNVQISEKGAKERKPIDRGSTACKSIFLFPKSVTATVVVQPSPAPQEAESGDFSPPGVTRTLSPSRS